MNTNHVCPTAPRHRKKTDITLGRSTSSHRQRGVALVFSLVTLLLLTLLSANMIQQNRLEFMMASNAQTQTETFSVAEDILKVTENYVETRRAGNREECRLSECFNNGGQSVACDLPAVRTVRYECFGSNSEPFDTSVGEWDLDPSTSGATPPDALYRCYTNGGKFTQLQAGDVDYSSPPPWDITDQLGLDTDKTGATEIRIASVACITDVGTEGICQYDDNGVLIENAYCASTPTNCKTEIYTLQVYSKTDSTSAQRIAESKFAVRCDADIDISAKP